MYLVEVDKDKCSGCEACVSVCPSDVFKMHDGKSAAFYNAEIIDSKESVEPTDYAILLTPNVKATDYAILLTSTCVSCERCVEVCLESAITIKEM